MTPSLQACAIRATTLCALRYKPYLQPYTPYLRI